MCQEVVNLAFAPADEWHDDGDQHADNADHDEQFDLRESAAAAHARCRRAEALRRRSRRAGGALGGEWNGSSLGRWGRNDRYPCYRHTAGGRRRPDRPMMAPYRVSSFGPPGGLVNLDPARPLRVEVR